MRLLTHQDQITKIHNENYNQDQREKREFYKANLKAMKIIKRTKLPL